MQPAPKTTAFESLFESKKGWEAFRQNAKNILKSGVVVETLVIASCLAAYLFVIRIPLPYVDQTRISQLVASSWFLQMVDRLVTGTSLGAATFGALGLLPYLLTGRSVMYLSKVHRFRAQMLIRLLWFILPLALLEAIFFVVLCKLPFALLPFLALLLSLAVGSLLIHCLDLLLRRSYGPSIFVVNAFLFLLAFLNDHLQNVIRDGWKTASVFALAAFLICAVLYRLLLTNIRKIRIVNITDYKPFSGFLSIPRVLSQEETSLLLWVVYLIVFISLFVDLIWGGSQQFFGNSLLALGIQVLFLTISMLLTRYVNIPSTYDHRAIAEILQENYWVIPGLAPGHATAAKLNSFFLQAQLTTYLFYLFSMALWMLAALLGKIWFQQDLRLEFGPFVLILLIFLCIEYLSKAYRRFLHIRFIGTGELSAVDINLPLYKRLKNQEEVAVLNWLNQKLETGPFSEELKEKIRQVKLAHLENRLNPLDLINLLREVSIEYDQYLKTMSKEEQSEFENRGSLSDLMIGLSVGTVITLLLMGLIALVFRLVAPDYTQTNEYQITMLFTAIPTWLALSLQFGLDILIKRLIKKLRRV